MPVVFGNMPLAFCLALTSCACLPPRLALGPDLWRGKERHHLPKPVTDIRIIPANVIQMYV